MSRRTPVLLAVLLAGARASAEPEAGRFRGTALSLGSGLPVCARVTFDRRAAESGGRILVLDVAEAGDEQAIRLSEAVIARRGGLSSRAGTAARRHGVPALALGQGRWDGAAPALYLDEPEFGAERGAAGFTYVPVTGSRERALREGDAAVVDAATGSVWLVPAEEADARVGAAEAARAYDGLRDAQALENWLASGADAGRGAALLEELVPRVLSGRMSAADLARARRAAERAAPASERERMRRAESRAFRRALLSARGRAEDCREAARHAGDAAALERLADESAASAEGVAGAARLLSLSDGGASASLLACRDAARRAAKSRAGRPVGLAEAAAASGADRPEGEELSAGAWARFVESNGLAEWLARTVDDASLGLRRKSERVRERVLAGRLEPVAAASGRVLIVGEDASLIADGPADAALRVREAWAASWAPGPLGARLRAGRPLAYEGRVRVEKITKAEVSGVAFSRDPGSGRRERIQLEVSPGGFDEAGAAGAQSYVLDRLSGRELAPRAGGGTDALLSPERLARVARLARALDAWKGAGVEVAFSFVGPRLLVHHARALEAPRPLVPLADPAAPRVEADQILDVRRVGL